MTLTFANFEIQDLTSLDPAEVSQVQDRLIARLGQRAVVDGPRGAQRAVARVGCAGRHRLPVGLVERPAAAHASSAVFRLFVVRFSVGSVVLLAVHGSGGLRSI